MSNDIAFHIATFTEDDETFPIPLTGNYNYWISLLHYFLPKADSIEWQCWNEERETIEEMTFLHKHTLNISYEEHMTIFQGKITSSLKDYVLDSHLDAFKRFKWFTVNIYQGEKLILHAGHWATEFFIPHVSEKDLAVIKSITPDETDFHHLY